MTAIRLSCLVTAAALVGASLLGCSGDDTTQPAEDSGVDQAVVDSGQDAAKDAGKDSTVKDTGTDAAQDSSVDSAGDAIADGSSDASDAAQDASGDAGDGGLAAEGTPCNPPNAVETEACGLCGTHKRACLASADAGYVWGPWGFCQGQPANACDPNLTYADSACGNCGVLKKVCLNNCSFDLSQQCTEPPNACKPGATNFVLGLSCDGGGREQTCGNQCTFGNFGSCQGGPTIGGITASETVGQTVSDIFTLPASPKLNRPSGVLSFPTCPTSFESTQTSYHYASVKNTSNKTLTVAVYSTAQSGGPTDVIVTLYPGAVPPADNDLTARQSCMAGTTPNDECYFTVGSPSSCPSSGYFGGHNNITIPANTALIVYAAAYGTSSSGPYQLNVYTSAAN